MWGEEEGQPEGPDAGSTALADVTFDFEVDGVDARWGVRAVTLREAVCEPFRGIIEALEGGQTPEPSSLLGKRFVLRMERGDEQRTVRGLIRQASSGEETAGAHYTLHVVPSAARVPADPAGRGGATRLALRLARGGDAAGGQRRRLGGRRAAE